jgi:hypothetical protein
MSLEGRAGHELDHAPAVRDAFAQEAASFLPGGLWRCLREVGYSEGRNRVAISVESLESEDGHGE